MAEPEPSEKVSNDAPGSPDIAQKPDVNVSNEPVIAPVTIAVTPPTLEERVIRLENELKALPEFIQTMPQKVADLMLTKIKEQQSSPQALQASTPTAGEEALSPSPRPQIVQPGKGGSPGSGILGLVESLGPAVAEALKGGGGDDAFTQMAKESFLEMAKTSLNLTKAITQRILASETVKIADSVK